MPQRPLVLDPDIDIGIGDAGSQGPADPDIHCPHCNWTPTSADRWRCTCGSYWNTFDTGGVCPSCLHQWTNTQCLACQAWAPHSAWYHNF